MKRYIFGLLCVILGLGSTVDSAQAIGTQPIDRYMKTCSTAAARAEQKLAIPSHLMQAIALAESGRWDKEKQAHFAWPWTVTSGGEGKFYPTKRDAMNAVRHLQSKGVTNIDVGCMQINLHYHGDAFASLGEAFDPISNTRYSAEFLKRLYDRTHSWMEAAGKYHSSTPEYHSRYRAKIARLWKAVIRKDRKANGNVMQPILASRDPREGSLYKPAPIDRTRTAMLNSKMKGRIIGEVDYDRSLDDEAALQGGDGGDTVQLADNRFDALRHSGIEAMKNRLRAQAERTRALGDHAVRQARTYQNDAYSRGSQARERFKQRRTQQLDVWRQRRNLK